MILEREIEATQMLDWLQAEAEAGGITLKIYRDSVEEREEQGYKFVGVRVKVENIDDILEEAKIKVRLEDAWNDREPPPEKRLWLISAGVPQGIW